MNSEKLNDVVRKTKRRKYGREPCDWIVGAVEVDGGANLPRLIKCGTNRTRYIKEFGMWGEFLCDKHFELKIARMQDEE